MKYKILGSLVLIGAMAISGTAFANSNQRPEPPKDFEGTGKRPHMMSMDINHRPPEPPEGKRHPMSGDKRPDKKPDKKPDRKPDKKPDKKY